MRNILKIIPMLFILVVLKANATNDSFDYPWTEKHIQLTEYISKYKNRIIEYTPYKIKQSKKFLKEIEIILEDVGVPKELAILAAIESNFNSSAVSQSNAVGMWQFKAETARDWGLTVNSTVDERKNWRKSSRAAARYLKWLAEDNFDGNYETAILSYNAGVGKISRLIKKLDTEDPWVLITYKEHLPEESREFLPKYISFMHYFYHLKKEK